MVDKGSTDTVPIDAGDPAAGIAAGIGPNRGNHLGDTSTCICPADSRLRYVQQAVGSEFQAARVVKTGRDHFDRGHRTVGAAAKRRIVFYVFTAGSEK